MTFTQAALVVVGLAAVALGLTCYHLLSRLDLLERAVSGGLQPPSRRLTREEFEQRFRRATARSELARDLGHGVLLVVGTDFPDSPLEAALDQLHRGDGLWLAGLDTTTCQAIESLELPGLETVDLRDTSHDADALGIGVTPFIFVIDDRRITAARPIASTSDLLDVLHHSTS